jgi:hypothetical protein
MTPGTIYKATRMWKGGALQALGDVHSENVLRSVVGRGTTNQRAPPPALRTYPGTGGNQRACETVEDERVIASVEPNLVRSTATAGDAATCVAGRGARLFVANRIGWIRKDLVTACRHNGSGWATRVHRAGQDQM